MGKILLHFIDKQIFRPNKKEQAYIIWHRSHPSNERWYPKKRNSVYSQNFIRNVLMSFTFFSTN